MPTKRESDNRQKTPDRSYRTYPAQRARISMIATPIGNLTDITLRAQELLERVDELWCEDTRHTQALLSALSISNPRLKRVDQHTSESELRKLLARVEAGGQWIGVVTDAGTPGVSDPGAMIAQMIGEFPGIRLESVPGASAVSAWVSIAGISGNSFIFQGFFPRTAKEAVELLNDLKSSSTSPNWIFFESPHRIKETIATLSAWCEALDFTPKFVFAKELTKLHESIFSGVGKDFLTELAHQGFDERGEWVFGIILPKDCVRSQADQAGWELALECLISAEISPKAATDVIIEKFPIAKNLAYKKALELQKKIKKN